MTATRIDRRKLMVGSAAGVAALTMSSVPATAGREADFSTANAAALDFTPWPNPLSREEIETGRRAMQQNFVTTSLAANAHAKSKSDLMEFCRSRPELVQEFLDMLARAQDLLMPR